MTEKINKKKNVLLVLLTLFIIFITDTVLFGTNFNQTFVLIQRVSVVLLGSILFIVNVFKQGIRRSTVLLFITIIFVFASMILNGGSVFYYITIAFSLLFGFSFSSLFSIKDFSKHFIRILFVISVFSLFCEALRPIILKTSFIPTITNVTGVKFKFLLLTNVDASVLTPFTRNFGPFWEPGAFQFYINIAIFFILFVESRINVKAVFKILVLFVALVSTGSGAAVIPFALMVFSFFLHKKVHKKLLLVILAFLAVFIICYFGLLNSVLTKTFDSGSKSFQIRYYNIIGNFYAFTKSPLIGLSADNCIQYRVDIYHMYSEYVYSQSVNTIPTFFAYFGVYFGLFYVANIVLTIKTLVEKRKINDLFVVLLLFVAFFIMTSNENLTSSLIIFVLPFLRKRKMYKKVEAVENGKITYCLLRQVS